MLGHEVKDPTDVDRGRDLWLCQCEGCAKFVSLCPSDTRFVIKGVKGRVMVTAAGLLPMMVMNRLDDWAEAEGCGYIREVFMQTNDKAGLSTLVAS